MAEINLGVNIDHVATLRQARRVAYPSIVAAAQAAERGGADGITVHLREDRRHIQEADVEALATAVATKLNLEIAGVGDMVQIARRIAPRDVCLVPERRAELTTEGGLDVVGNAAALAPIVAELRAAKIRVSLFIDPDEAQVDASARLGAEVVEIHTGSYADAPSGAARDAELARIRRASEHGAAPLGASA